MAPSWLFTLFPAAQTCLASSWPSYRYLQRSCISDDCSALRITVSNPPINLWDANVVVEFNSFLTELNSSKHNSTKVVVVSSDVSGFWISHLDANIFTGSLDPSLNVTDIINGRTWGAGNEQAMHMDMRFAGPDAQFSTPEVGLGVIHVGGMQQLRNLIGGARAAEHLLSGEQVDATEAARIGWVNSAYSSKDALRKHVDSFAKRVALFPIEAILATKAGIAEQGPTQQQIQDDMDRYNELATTKVAQESVGKFLAVSRNQSRQWELNMGTNMVQLYK
ncbi:ClpP/crotonase-like domain-containing protein [Mariannaea sp. PMI_226]|nr:ClpP/crotonase-like domain-containing protein [Mariannaea sp. PMI_226]